jgi:hypothetical protein
MKSGLIRALCTNLDVILHGLYKCVPMNSIHYGIKQGKKGNKCQNLCTLPIKYQHLTTHSSVL